MARVIPVISTNKSPCIECIIPVITSYITNSHGNNCGDLSLIALGFGIVHMNQMGSNASSMALSDMSENFGDLKVG
jgi:hypothetical protein